MGDHIKQINYLAKALGLIGVNPAVTIKGKTAVIVDRLISIGLYGTSRKKIANLIVNRLIENVVISNLLIKIEDQR